MDLVQGAQAFQILAAHLKETGEGGLRRDLQKTIRDAAQPIATAIGSITNLNDHMPDRYAAVLKADLRVTTHALAGGTNPGITILAQAPTAAPRGGRKIRQREEGRITHPVFGNREVWKTQPPGGGMVAGFFSSPAGKGAPGVRDKILQAMSDTCDKIVRKA